MHSLTHTRVRAMDMIGGARIVVERTQAMCDPREQPRYENLVAVDIPDENLEQIVTALLHRGGGQNLLSQGFMDEFRNFVLEV